MPDYVWERARAIGAAELVAELRGWRGDLVGPRRSFTPTVSELSSPCPSKRDVYLSRVMGLKPPDGQLLRVGAVLHSAFLEPFRAALRPGRLMEELAARKAGVLRGLTGQLRRRAAEAFDVAASFASSWVFGGRRLPVAVEPELPGSPIGLSGVVKPDLVVGVVPVDFVFGDGSRKELAVAAYAMALEAAALVPVNFGVVVSLSWEGRVSWRVVTVDDELRGRVLDVRDEIARIVESGDDPGRADSCPQLCPWRGVCLEGAVRL